MYKDTVTMDTNIDILQCLHERNHANQGCWGELSFSALCCPDVTVHDVKVLPLFGFFKDFFFHF